MDVSMKQRCVSRHLRREVGGVGVELHFDGAHLPLRLTHFLQNAPEAQI